MVDSWTLPAINPVRRIVWKQVNYTGKKIQVGERQIGDLQIGDYEALENRA